LVIDATQAHRRVLAKHALAEGALVQRAVAIGEHRRDARYVAGVDGALQQSVDRILESHGVPALSSW